MTAPERVVVRAPNWLGDVVLSLAAVRDLRRNFPSARIEVLARASVAPLYAALAERRVIRRAAFSFAVQEERTSLTDSIKKFTGELAESLKKAGDDISNLEVVTFTSDDLKTVQEQKFAEGAGGMKRRALTRIAFDGDVQVCVPEKDGNVDQAVWDVHLSMVKAAQENRAAFLQTMAELATKLIGMLGGRWRTKPIRRAR